MTLLVPSAAWAQSVPDLPDRYRSDVAGARPQQAWDPLGVRLGGFIAHADGVIDIGYNSNLFGRDTDIVGDRYARIAPSLRLSSDWGRHSVELGAAADITRFASQSRQNTDEFRLRAGGVIELGDRIALRPTVSYAKEAEPRGSVGNRYIEGDPLFRRELSATLGGRYDGGLIAAELVLAYRRERYGDIRIGDVLTSLRARDENAVGGRATLLYQATPAFAGLVQLVADDSSNPHPEFGSSRDARGYALLAGVRLDPSGLVAGQAAVGFRRRFFDGSDTASRGLTYDIKLQYYPTELLTVAFHADQQFRNGGIVAANRTVVGRQSINLAWEMYRNLNLSLQGTREATDYRDVDTDTTLGGLSMRAVYTARRALQLSAYVALSDNRTSRASIASGYTAWRGGLTARVRI